MVAGTAERATSIILCVRLLWPRARPTGLMSVCEVNSTDIRSRRITRRHIKTCTWDVRSTVLWDR